MYWIGDSLGANYIAQKFSSTNAFQLRSLFDEVVESSKFETVGGHVVVARGAKEGFRFIPEMHLVSPKYIPVNGINVVDFGTAATGGFGYTTVVPKEAGINGWGVYYFQGKVGKFYRVDLEKNIGETLSLNANTVEQFTEVLEQETGLHLQFCGSLG